MTVAFKQNNIITEIGPGGLLQSLFSTVAYHLESEVWGSVYPFVMKELYSGLLNESSAEKALIEAIDIRDKLSKLDPQNIIWDIENLSEKAPWDDQAIGGHIQSVAQFYITKNGLNLVDELVDSIKCTQKYGGNVEIISYDGAPPFYETKVSANSIFQRLAQASFKLFK